MTDTNSGFTTEKFIEFWTNFKGLPQQKAGVEELFNAIQKLEPSLLSDTASWVRNYRKQSGSPPSSGPITPERMNALTGYKASSFDSKFCDSFNNMLAATKFDKSPDAMCQLIGNLMTESANFVYMKEIDSGSYLEGRRDLGNTQPGDGPRFKGCGPLQVTGRAHFAQFAEWLKKNKGKDDPRILKEGTDYVADAYPFEIAISWIQSNGLLNVALNKGIDGVCLRINGGRNGWDSRHKNYAKAKRIFGVD
jgi:putative chitinase